VTGKAHRRFWKNFEKLPPAVQDLARKKYALWKRNSFHPSLAFEERRNGICVLRIGTVTVRLACARAISSCGSGSERTKSITGLLSEPSSDLFIGCWMLDVVFSVLISVLRCLAGSSRRAIGAAHVSPITFHFSQFPTSVLSHLTSQVSLSSPLCPLPLAPKTEKPPRHSCARRLLVNRLPFRLSSSFEERTEVRSRCVFSQLFSVSAINVMPTQGNRVSARRSPPSW